MKNGIFVNPNSETYELVLIKKDDGNTPFNYGETDVVVNNELVNETHNPYIKFRGRPANSLEIKQNRVVKGVMGSNDGIMLFVSNLPEIADIGDRVTYLGKTYTIQGIGVFLDKNNIVNGGIFSNDYINDRSPKSITLG